MQNECIDDNNENIKAKGAMILRKQRSNLLGRLTSFLLRNEGQEKRKKD